jgi:hypothetical protein
MVEPGGRRQGDVRRWMTASVGWAAIALVIGGGCGGPPIATVRGRVTLDGRPLTAGTVVFEGDGRSYTGSIGADGRFELRFMGEPGIRPGTYGVAVIPPEAEVVADPKTTDLRAVNPVDPRNYPERYRLPSTSGISRTVSPGEATIDIDLQRGSVRSAAAPPQRSALG